MAKGTSYMQDFVAGVEPTGVQTFRNSLKNEDNHTKHKAAGNIGGFVGGALAGAAIPAGLAGLGALALRKKNPIFAKDLTSMAKGSLEAFNPRKLVRYGKSMGAVSDYRRQASNLLKDTESIGSAYSSVQRRLGKTGLRGPEIKEFMDSAITGRAPLLKGRAIAQKLSKLSPADRKAIEDSARSAGQQLQSVQGKQARLTQAGANLSKNYFGGARVEEGVLKGMTALTTAGTAVAGGLVNAAGSQAQYNAGLKTKKDIEKQAGASKFGQWLLSKLEQDSYHG